MRELVSDMNAGRVQMLLIVGESNPVQTAPADLRFRTRSARCRGHHSGLFLDETATLCHWHVPAAHYLEAWSDAGPVDGTTSIVQPLMQRGVWRQVSGGDGHTLSDRPERAGYDVVREYLMAQPQAGASRCDRCDECDGCGGCGGGCDGWRRGWAGRQHQVLQAAPAAPGASSTPAANA